MKHYYVMLDLVGSPSSLTEPTELADCQARLTEQDPGAPLTGPALFASPRWLEAQAATAKPLESLELVKPAAGDNKLLREIEDLTAKCMTLEVVRHLFCFNREAVEDCCETLVEKLHEVIQVQGAGQAGFRQEVMKYEEGGSAFAEFKLTDPIVTKATAALKLFAVFASNLVNLDSSELRENLAPAAIHSVDQCLVGEIKHLALQFAKAPEANLPLDFLQAVFKQRDPVSKRGLFEHIVPLCFTMGLYRNGADQEHYQKRLRHLFGEINAIGTVIRMVAFAQIQVLKDSPDTMADIQSLLSTCRTVNVDGQVEHHTSMGLVR